MNRRALQQQQTWSRDIYYCSRRIGASDIAAAARVNKQTSPRVHGLSRGSCCSSRSVLLLQQERDAGTPLHPRAGARPLPYRRRRSATYINPSLATTARLRLYNEAASFPFVVFLYSCIYIHTYPRERAAEFRLSLMLLLLARELVVLAVNRCSANLICPSATIPPRLFRRITIFNPMLLLLQRDSTFFALSILLLLRQTVLQLLAFLCSSLSLSTIAVERIGN